MDENKFDIGRRIKSFVVRVTRFVNKLPNTEANRIYKRQVIRSSSSIGANLIEADGALTKRDFLNKLGISRREAKETKYWLEIIYETSVFNESSSKGEIKWLMKESEEIKLILSSIIIKCSSKK